MHRRISQLEREVDDIRFENIEIIKDVETIKKELVDKTPDHFSARDIMRAFVGSLFLGFSVTFSGNIINIANSLPGIHLYAIAFFTILLLTVEIYYVGYSRVENKEVRGFAQFWIKRLLTFYAVALIVAFLLAYVFGLYYLVESWNFFKLVVIISAPCAVGASIGDLMKKY